MPRADKLCSKPDCFHVQPCPDHPKIAWEGSTRSKRLPKDWSRRRLKVLARDPICCICNQKPSQEVDHIEHGDQHALSNLQGVCVACHQKKTAEEAAQGRRNRHN